MDLLLNALTLKGYSAMSLVLWQTLEEASIPYAVNPNTTFTIFCPPDEAFFALKYTHPPVTLLQYHAVPLKLDKKSIELSFQLGSKLDTLLPGHPLLVTRPPNGGHVFINEVRIMEWDVYRDNRFIIHGVEDFFDPALQTVSCRILDYTGSPHRAVAAKPVAELRLQHYLIINPFHQSHRPESEPAGHSIPLPCMRLFMTYYL
ncbi:hypothetical protein RJ640_018694 [Escallonia rubra]|uniref:FAS1 domain-containing protein n=1 Tax=Escallonia rubra TaxID=112253 RepID=A0AA88ULC8_9ASTE|nr:hypothetical protein RJ640_018694 [Escallonia rubra]